MTKLWINPMLLGIAGLAGWAVCTWAGKPEQARMAALALCSCMMALLLGLAPFMLSSGGGVASMTQIALVGSTIFLLASVVLAAGVMFVFKPGIGFAVWMCGFFWLSLMGLAMTAIKALRSASATSGK